VSRKQSQDNAMLKVEMNFVQTRNFMIGYCSIC